jgi:predicted nucleic acid-binding Zn ribbon protein
MRGREAQRLRLDRCSVCSRELPEGSRLDRRTCSDACRQAERRSDVKARKNHVGMLKLRGRLPEPDGVYSAEAVAEIEFDTELMIERTTAIKPDGFVTDDERTAIRRSAERAYDRREPERRRQSQRWAGVRALLDG